MKMRIAVLLGALMLIISGTTMIVFAQEESPGEVTPQGGDVEPQIAPCCCGATLLIAGFLGMCFIVYRRWMILCGE